MEEQQCLDGLEDDRTIFRHPKDQDHPYVMVAKSSALDERFSGLAGMAARHLLTVMLCMPDDWEFNLRHLAEKCRINKDTAMDLIRELIAFGYVVRDQHRRQSGRFSSIRYLVFERPTVSAITVSGPTGHGPTAMRSHRDAVSPCPVGAYILNTPDPETEYRKTEEAPPPVPTLVMSVKGQIVEPHRLVAIAWYRRFQQETGKLIGPSEKDFLAAEKACARMSPVILEGAIGPYFEEAWWFTRHKQTKKPSYSFRGFLDHVEEIIAAAGSGRSTGPPRPERRCPKCQDILTFGSGRFTRCRCGAAWEIGDSGELVDCSREATTA